MTEVQEMLNSIMGRKPQRKIGLNSQHCLMTLKLCLTFPMEIFEDVIGRIVEEESGVLDF